MYHLAFRMLETVIHSERPTTGPPSVLVELSPTAYSMVGDFFYLYGVPFHVKPKSPAGHLCSWVAVFFKNFVSIIHWLMVFHLQVSSSLPEIQSSSEHELNGA